MSRSGFSQITGVLTSLPVLEIKFASDSIITVITPKGNIHQIVLYVSL